jgi:hypothetical protein
MISRAPAISETTPAPGYRATSTVGKIAEQGPLTGPNPTDRGKPGSKYHC